VSGSGYGGRMAPSILRFATAAEAKQEVSRLNRAAGEAVWMHERQGQLWIVRRVTFADLRPVTLADLQRARRQQR